MKLGVIGCGRVSYAHRDAASNLADDVELISASDIDVEKMAEFCKGADIGKQFLDYHDLIDDRELDGMIICLPHALHHTVANEALEAGKHVLVEKPMALNYELAVQMADTAQKMKKQLMVAQNRRFSRAAMEVKAMIDSGKIGELIRIVLNFFCYFEKAPAEWWFKKEISGVPFVTILQGSHNRTPESVTASAFNKKFPFEDESDIFIDYNGATAAIHLSLNTKPPLVHEVIAVGTEGTIRLNEYLSGKNFGFGYELQLDDKTLFREDQEPSNFTLQLEEFVRSVREQRQPIASGEDVAANTMKIITLAGASIKTKTTVPF